MRCRSLLFVLACAPLGCGASSRASPANPVDGGSPPPGGDAAGADADTPATCAAPLPTDVQIPNLDLQGYPPYAADGCTLVYVADAGGAGGDLRVRDLTTGAETLLAPAAESPRRPSIAGGVIAWEAKDGVRAVVRVRANGAVTTLVGAFDHAGEPRATGDAVAFTGWLTADDRSDTDVFLYEVASGRLTAVIGGPAQQRFADVTRGMVAAADFSEDPDGVFDDNDTDLADIVLFDRGSGAATHRARTGKQAFPMIASATRVGYLDWGEVHPEPKLSQYELRVGDVTGPVAGDVSVAMVTNSEGRYLLPAGRGGVLEWVDHPLNAPASLWRVPADMSRAPATVPGLDGLDLYAPTSSASFTLLATRATAATALYLRGVAR